MKKPVKPRPIKKKNPFESLYNRLQGRERSEAVEELIRLLDASDVHDLIETILGRTATEIKTYQFNSTRGTFTVQINMRYENREVKPVDGYKYPSVYVIKTWNSLIDGVILSYVILCKQIGRVI